MIEAAWGTIAAGGMTGGDGSGGGGGGGVTARAVGGKLKCC